MASMDEQILRTAKEIVVKFIETGRVSPSGFREAFENIYRAVADTVNEPADAVDSESEPPSKP